MRKSPKDRARPGILEAVNGAERLALPDLGGVEHEGWYALRCARDLVNGETWPKPNPELTRTALAEFGEGVRRESLRTDSGSRSWLVTEAVEAALAFDAAGASGQGPDRAAAVRRVVNAEEKKRDEEQRRRAHDALQEAFRAIWNGEERVKLMSSNAMHEVTLLAAHRLSGGVVVQNDGVSVVYAIDWCAAVRKHSDAYLRDLGLKVERAVSEAGTPRAEQ